MNVPRTHRCNRCNTCGRCGGCKHNPCNRQGESTIFSAGSYYCEFNEVLSVDARECHTANIPTCTATIITIFVKNIGYHPIAVRLQNSPNGLDFTDDPQLLSLDAGETGYLIPYIFSKYMRLTAISEEGSAMRVWAQMQVYDTVRRPTPSCYGAHMQRE